MKLLSSERQNIPVSVRVSRFNGTNGTDEYHMVLSPLKLADFGVQINWLYAAYLDTLNSLGLDPETAVLRRFFCSDLANQSALLDKLPFSGLSRTNERCAISWVCQPPGSSAMVSLWAYHVHDIGNPLKKIRESNCLFLDRGGMKHYWTCGMNRPAEDTSYQQTMDIFAGYNDFLHGQGMSLEQNVIRTWFFVQNIDTNYREFTAARKEFFAAHGLTENTHFISSTAVQGSHANILAKVTMDAYSISGLKPGQVRFLEAPEHLSSTYVYGVTFERGTSVAYGDRKHLIISGTASIDSKGNVLYQGDLSRQLDRTIENMGALLENAGASLHDMVVMIAYVRDPADHFLVSTNMKRRFENIPVLTVCARVCRPDWLVEIEGIAIIPFRDVTLPAF